MGPKSKCTNCGAEDWIQSQFVNIIPQMAGGGGKAQPGDGLHVNMWMCKACWLLMPFGSSD